MCGETIDLQIELQGVRRGYSLTRRRELSVEMEVDDIVTMTEVRLNYCATLQIHKSMSNTINIRRLGRN